MVTHILSKSDDNVSLLTVHHRPQMDMPSIGCRRLRLGVMLSIKWCDLSLAAGCHCVVSHVLVIKLRNDVCSMMFAR